jgi:uncharacterized membrane protein YqjE
MSIGKREHSPDESGVSPSVSVGETPRDWVEALLTLAFSRAEIIRIEAKAASRGAMNRLALLLVGIFALFAAWALALAASIGAIAASSSWEWYHVAFASAGAHVFIGAIFLLVLRARNSESFPVTRAEFQKDREWLNRNKKQ